MKDVLSRGPIEHQLDHKLECSIVLIPASLVEYLDKMRTPRVQTLGITFYNPEVSENDNMVLGVDHEKLKTSWSRILHTEIQIGSEIVMPFERDHMLSDPVSSCLFVL